MNIREQLLLEHSKSNAEFITAYIGIDKNRVEELVNCFLSNEYRVSQRSAMVISRLGDIKPDLLTIHIERLVNCFIKKGEKDSVIRALVRFFQFYDLPEEIQGVVLNQCYVLLLDTKQAIAIRAFSIGVIYRISKDYEELRKELKLVLEDLNTGDSSGLENRRINILKKL